MTFLTPWEPFLISATGGSGDLLQDEAFRMNPKSFKKYICAFDGEDTNFFATWDVVSGISLPDRGPTGAKKIKYRAYCHLVKLKCLI